MNTTLLFGMGFCKETIVINELTANHPRRLAVRALAVQPIVGDIDPALATALYASLQSPGSTVYSRRKPSVMRHCCVGSPSPWRHRTTTLASLTPCSSPAVVSNRRQACTSPQAKRTSWTIHFPHNSGPPKKVEAAIDSACS